MDLPQVDTCCFGLVPLKTGAMIVGIVTLILELTTQGYNYYYTTDFLSTIYAILVICGIISSVLVIYGVFTNNRLFVKIYIISFALLVIFTIIILVLVLVKYGAGQHRTTFIINTAVYVCVILYCLIIVNSYYKIMA